MIRTTHNRKIILNETEYKLKNYLIQLPEQTTIKHIIKAQSGVCSKEVLLKVSWTKARLFGPLRLGKSVIGLLCSSMVGRLKT